MMESRQIEMNDQVPAVQLPDFIRFQTISDGKKFVMGLDHLYRDLLQEGTDYGKLPGTTKPCMFKSGGEILAKYFGLTTSSRLVQRIAERDPPYIEFEFITDVYYMGTKVADGSGSCNSMEPKYAFRYDHGVQREATKNEIFGLLNTIMKMALKRSYIDAILRATGASRIFTQDLEDEAQQEGTAVSSHDRHGDAGNSGERQITEKQTVSIRKFLDGNGVHRELATLLIRKSGKRLEDLSSREASRILDQLFNFRCATLVPEEFVMKNEGFRLENGVLRPSMNSMDSVDLDRRIELASACWIWNAEKRGFMRKEGVQ